MRLHNGSFSSGFRLWRPLPAPRPRRNPGKSGHRLCVRRRVVRRQGFLAADGGRGQTTRTPQWAWWSGRCTSAGSVLAPTVLRLSLSVSCMLSIPRSRPARRGPATCFSSTWAMALAVAVTRAWSTWSTAVDVLVVSRVARRELPPQLPSSWKPRTRREGAIILNTFLRTSCLTIPQSNPLLRR